MNYNELNLHMDTEMTPISIGAHGVIHILHYLPIEDKNTIIELVLQNSMENGIFNFCRMQMFFKLYVTYMYTDIAFTDYEKDNPMKLYDELESNGIFTYVFNGIAKSEISFLEETLQRTALARIKYKSTIASVLNSFIETLPANAEAAQNILNKFNPEDFSFVMDFVRAANGGRDIN